MVATLAVHAQTNPPAEGEEDNGFLINLIQEKISGPGRYISIEGVSGALSSQAEIGALTISDEEGPWLRIEDVQLNWSRLKLLVGNLEVNELSVGVIDFMRKPIPVETAPTLEAKKEPFALPELPVSILLESLDIESIVIAEEAFGEAAELTMNGSLQLADGNLDTRIDVDRLDEPGGTLDVVASFENENRILGLDLDFQSPGGGLVSELLNLENDPAIDLTVQGEGPLDNVDVTFGLDADEEQLLGGLIALRGVEDGLGFDVDVNGGVSPLIPADYREFFEGNTALTVSGTQKSAGGIRVDSLDLDGPVLQLEGQAETGEDGFLRSLNLSGMVGDPAAEALVLPVPGASTRLNSATIYANYGTGSRWEGFIVLDRLEAAGISAEDITLKLGGLAQDLDDPDQRSVTVALEGLATGLYAEDPEIAEAIGDRLDLFADAAMPPGGPMELRQVQAFGNGLSLFASGEWDQEVFEGNLSARLPELGILSGLANRPLDGGVSLYASGSVTPGVGGFDLALDGGTTDVTIGDPRVDALMAGETEISGRLVRDEDGFRAEDFGIENNQFSLASEGRASSTDTDIGVELLLTDLGLLDERASGELTLTANAEGQGFPVDVTVQALLPDATILERQVSRLELGFDGAVDGSTVTGDLEGSGELDDLPVELAGSVDAGPSERSVEGLRLAVGPSILTGDVQNTVGEPYEGALRFRSPDIAPLAALGLIEAGGALQADVTLDRADTGQGVDVEAQARDLAVMGNTVDSLDMDMRVTDALAAPMADGTVAVRGVNAGGFVVTSLDLEAEQLDPQAMAVSADTELEIGTTASLAGQFERVTDGFAMTLDQLAINHDAESATLEQPATVSIVDGAVYLTPLALDFGTGRLAAEGRVDDNLDLVLDVDDMPVALANAVAPDLGLEGVLNGTANVTGPRSTPVIDFDISGTGLAAAATRSQDLPALNVQAQGQTEDGLLNLDAALDAEGGLAANVAGVVPLGEGEMDLSADLAAFPLQLIDPAIGNQGLRGTVTGTASVTGPLSAPEVVFDLGADAISTTLLRENALPDLALNVAGGFADNAVSLDTASVSGPFGLNLNASGVVPFTSDGLDLSVNGAVPLQLARPVLAKRAASATGTVNLDATVQGSLAAPQLGGSVNLAGGTYTDPEANLKLEDIVLAVNLAGETVNLQQLSAQVTQGGTITGQGTMSLVPRSDLPTQAAISFNDVRYTDGAFVATQFSGDLNLEGDLLGQAVLSGEFNLGKTDVSIPEGFGSSLGVDLEEIVHLRPPARVTQTLNRAEVGEPAPRPQSSDENLILDITVNAPNQIFIRGRGLNAELGGDVQITGPATDPQPVGEFELRRGDISILTQRIEFTQGEVTLDGNLDPQLDFVASTVSGDVTAMVNVEGRASDPDISFTSSPELPEDEVLSRLLFNRASQDLSPFQIAQLAAAAAELAGVGGPGVMSNLRSATGLDDLDVLTDESGATAVRAGKYISDDVYFDVQTDSEGESRAGVVVELTDNLEAEGSVGSDGNTIFGLFFKHDY